MLHPANHFFDHTPESLAVWCDSVGMPRFRAKQLMEWVYLKGVVDPEKMTSLSKADRDKVHADLTFLSGTTVRHQQASDGTQKLLVEWEDFAHRNSRMTGGKEVEAESKTVQAPADSMPSIPLNVLNHDGAQFGAGDPTRQTECVMIPTDERKTACISSQIGCPVGCRFCASGLGGLDHNLSGGRIVEQVWRLNQLPEVPRISNVVFMGMGEPLANMQNVIQAVRAIAAPWGMGISARRITISTVGLPKAIEKLADQLDLPVTLALSLHAPNDNVRRELIPWAEYTTVQDLLAACQKWFERTGREITLEYTLLRGVNDQPHHARELSEVAKTLRANINLIRFNEVSGLPFQRPLDEDVLAFQEHLRSKGVNAHIRASRGRDIAAACGQLRHETGNKARARAAGAAQT